MNMNPTGGYNPEIPQTLRDNLTREKEQALTLYIDFVIDGTASMHSVFPAVYFAIVHILQALNGYEINPMIGLTVLRNEQAGEMTELVEFEEGRKFTSDMEAFLKKIRFLKLYGGGDDGKESVHTAIRRSLDKFEGRGRGKVIMVFTDAYESNDTADYMDVPVGQVIFFSTDELAEEDFRFCFLREDGELDEEASPMFLSLESLLKPMSTEYLDNIVKPVKDLMKGVSIGA